MRKVLLSICALFILVPTIACAATFRSTEKGTTTVEKTETVKNAYLAGNSVNVQGNISEDLVAAGNTLTVAGNVNDSVNVAGNTVNLNGPIGKSVRAVGATINLNSTVGSDFLAGGGTITLSSTSEIKGDASLAGGTIDVNGKINGNAYITGGQVNINSEITGDVIIKQSGHVTLGDNAKIGGKLDYEAQDKATISDKAVVTGATIYKEITNKNTFGHKAPAMFTSFSLLFVLAGYLLLLLLIYLLPKTVKSAVEQSIEKPLENMGLGFVYLIVAPIASLVLCLTVIGIPIGFFSLAVYFIALGIAKLLVAVIVGTLLFKWLGKAKSVRIDWLTVLVGIVVTTIIGVIPFIGWLAVFVIFLMALAVLVRNSYNLIRSEH